MPVNQKVLVIFVDGVVILGLIIGLLLLGQLFVLRLVDGEGRFLEDGRNGLEDFLLLDVVLLVGADDVRDVGDGGLYVARHDID
jgi:hypothetical protein